MFPRTGAYSDIIKEFQENWMTDDSRDQNYQDQTDVIRQVGVHHQLLLDLCRQLEELADRLPDQFDIQECLAIAWKLYPVVREAHRFEEETLFPILASRLDTEQSINENLERLKFEHWEDESTAEDISVFLRQMVSDPSGANAEKIAYMLRGFFGGLRRHIAFEKVHLLPLLDQ